MKNIDLGKGSVPKLLLRLALPSVAAQIINMLYNLVDRIYVGGIKDIGTDALAGLGVCFPLLIIVAAFSVLIGVGGAPLAAIKLGEGKRDDAEKILNNGVVLLLGFGILLTIVLIVFSEPLLILFGSPTKSLEYGVQYMRIYAIGTIFVMFSMGLNSFISTQGFAFTSMMTVAIGAVLNIVLDPIFIFGLGLGVRGAALATILSQAVSCLWVVLFFFSKKSFLKIKPKLFALSKKLVLPMLALGLSPFIMQVTESAVQIVFNMQLFKYTNGSGEYTAALTIMLSVMQMVTLPINGLGTGAQPLISFNYGRGDAQRIKQTVKWLFFLALGLSAVVWIFCMFTPSLFAIIFSATPAVTELIKKYMPIFMMGTLLFSAQFSFQNVFLALGQAKKSMILALTRKVFLLIPLTFIIPLILGVSGIFWAEGIADILAAVITTLTFALSFKGILRRRNDVLNAENTPLKNENMQETNK